MMEIYKGAGGSSSAGGGGVPGAGVDDLDW